MRKARNLIISLIVLFAFAGGTAFALSIWEPYTLWSVQMNPAGQLQRSFQKTADELREGLLYEIPTAVTQVFTTGAIAINLTTTDNTSVDNMLYLREDGIVSVGNINTDGAILGGYGFWLGKESIVVETSGPVSSTAYGLHFDTLKEDLKYSALLDYLGVSYDEACTYIDTVLDVLQTDADNITQKNETQINVQLAELLKSCPVIVEEKTLNVDSESLTVYHIAYTISPEQICEMAELLKNRIRVSETGSEDPDIEKNINELETAVIRSNATAIVDFYLHSQTQVVIQAGCRLDWMQEEETSTIIANTFLGETPSQSRCYTASVSIKSPGSVAENITLEYQRTNAHNLPGRKLVLSTNEESITLVNLQINEIAKTFECNLLDQTYTILGTCKIEEGNVEIQTLTDIGNLTLTFHETAEIPDVPGYINICSLTIGDLEALFTEPGPDNPGYTWESDVTVTVYGSDGSVCFLHYIGEYGTLADLMIDEWIADLDEGGKVMRVYVFGEEIPGDVWQVYVNDEQYEGSLYDLFLFGEVSIELIGAH